MSVVLRFVDMLRWFGLPVSPSETITAQQTFEFFGATDKRVLQTGLRAAILKRHEDTTIFDTCFNKFFSIGSTKVQAEISEISSEKEQFLQRIERTSPSLDYTIAQQLVNDQVTQAVQTAMNMMPGQGGSQGGIPLNEQVEELQQRLARSLYRTFGFTVPIRGLTPIQRNALAPEVISIAANLQQFSSLLTHQLKSEDRVKEQLKEKISQDQPENLYQLNQFLTQDLTTVSSTMANVKDHLLEIGKILASRERRRRKLAKQGRLDFRRTMRKNLQNNGIPLELIQKHKRIEDPEIIILNDVSGSTNWVADWFFVITYTAQQVYRKIRVFEFDNTMVEVTVALKRKTINRALEERSNCWEKTPRPRRIHSDYQSSLEDFFHLTRYRPLTRRTTVLILGDCRDFEGTWRTKGPISAELLYKVVLPTKRVIVLNPEDKSLWNTGDSVVQYFQTVGAEIFHVSTLNDLINFVFELKRN